MSGTQEALRCNAALWQLYAREPRLRLYTLAQPEVSPAPGRRTTPPWPRHDRDDKLVNLITAVSEKLEHLSETVQRVDRAHRTTHQLLFSESKDHGPALKEHRTPAHNLLFLWQSIRALVDAAHIDVHGDYVARAEDRPLLDPFARRSSSRAFLECPRARLDTTLLPLRAASAPRICPPRRNPQEEAPSGQGGLTPDGRLDLRRSTLEALLAAYLANIHILHPFLNKPKLRVMLDAFIEAFPDDTLAKDHESPDETSSLGRKRKRSRFDEGIGYHDTHTASFHPPQQQRVENAIVWLVLALGKICLHKKPLPEVFDGSPDAEAILSPAPSRDERSRDISPSSVDSLSAATLGDSHASAHGFVSPSQSSKIVLGDWQEGPLASYERNVDAVPGLAYYTAATAVLGSQADGTSLAHAQIFALAGLYKGQLARVRESISWISRSAQVVRVLLHVEGLFNNGPLPVAPNVRKSTRHKQSDDKDGYQDAIKLTAWSALQLESDILAELSFPSSGLPALELVPYDIPDCSVEPHSLDGVRATAYDHETVVLFYSAQTFLRTRLNNAHDEIYGKAGTGQPLPQIRDMLRAHDLVLTEWRTKLPPGLRWEDKDPPSSNILHARLRAKYWGARYIITRPFLDYVMHIMPYITSTSDVERAAKDARGDPRDPAEVRLLEAIAGMPRSEIEAAVESCIDAAMQSTVAFDGIQDRLIVTNIHGTAHA